MFQQYKEIAFIVKNNPDIFINVSACGKIMPVKNMPISCGKIRPVKICIYFLEK
jgi:hypothetical protein